MRWSAVFVVALAAPALAKRPAAAPPPDPAAVGASLLGAALGGDEAYEELRELCDTIGSRISGSPELDRAIAWGQAEMMADGLSVTTEPVMVPRWERGPAAAWVQGEADRPIGLLALGNSVSTPAGGLLAPVLVVHSFEELQARSAEVPGKIVVYNVPFTTYGETVRFRWDGPNQASKLGAVASLTRSVTPISLYTPHTGNQRFAEGTTPIPAAAITIEDAEHLDRLQQRGPAAPYVHLELQAETKADVPSANVVGELRGRERPDEVVVLGCHLDSWDVGEGAQDDGAGCVTVMQAGALLAALPVAPRRTVRVVLFTNEENGLRGGKGYAEAHAGERIVAAIEDDTGSGAPLGFGVDGEAWSGGAAGAAAILRERVAWVRPLLASVGADAWTDGGGGADIGPIVEAGALGIGLEHDMTGYWPIHHTHADTFEKVDPLLVRRNVAAVTLLAYALAETAELTRPAPAP